MIGKKNTGLFCLILAAIMLFGCVTTKNLQCESQMQSFSTGISVLTQYQIASKGENGQKPQQSLGLLKTVHAKNTEKIVVLLFVNNPQKIVYQLKKETIVEVKTPDGPFSTKSEEIVYKGRGQRVFSSLDFPVIINRKITIRITLLNKYGGMLLKAGEATYKCKP